jgi:hypothetical protein
MKELTTVGSVRALAAPEFHRLAQVPLYPRSPLALCAARECIEG